MIDKIENYRDDARSFTSRLLFIKDIFLDKYPQEDIMAKCITHKLKRSYLAYLKELEKSVYNLEDEDPIKILRRIKLD